MKYLLVCLTLFFLLGCPFPFYKSDPIRIAVKSPRLTLAWDPPETNIPHSPSYVTAYRIYYKEMQTSGWTFLDEIEASENPQYTVNHEDLRDGDYAFAIRSVGGGGAFSPLHTSLDWSADPITGWYVSWLKNE